MSNQIPSREERLRRAHESAERIKNQWDIANDVYDDVRDVISTENPQMEDFELPEAIERRSAETINLEEEAKAWQQEIKHLKERNMRYEQEIEKLGDDIHSSQMTDDEPDDITQQRLRQLTRLIEGYPKLATLLFQDEAHFQPAIQNMKRSGNQLLSKLHNLHGEVNEIRVDIQDALKDYRGRLNDLVKPLQKELAETQDQLESAQTLQSTTDAELTKVKEELQEVMEQHQTLEKSLQDDIDKSKAKILDLKKEATTASRQNASYQAEIEKLKSEEATTMRYLSTEIESVTAENIRAKAQNMQLKEMLSQQDSQHNAEIQEMTEAKNSLSARNDEQEIKIETLQDTLKEIEESLSGEIDQLQVQIQTLNAGKDALSAEIGQCETQIHGLEAAKDELTTQTSEYQAKTRALEGENDALTSCNEEYQDQIRSLEAEKAELTSRNEEYQDRIRTLEAEKGDLDSRNEENQSQYQTLIQAHRHDSERLKTANSRLDNQVNDLQEAVRTMQLEKNNLASQIENRTAKNQQLVTEAEGQEQQHLDRIAQLTVELDTSDETLQNALNEADEERSSYLQENQQLQNVLFSNMLTLQGDKDDSLPTAGTRLFFGQQGRLTSQHIPAFGIKGPLGDILDQLTKSEITASLKTYQLALQGLGCLHASSESLDSLLGQLVSCQQWLNTACKNRTSILGLALDFTIKTIEQGLQSEPRFSTSQFDAARIINSTNSDLPDGTSIIADGFTGVILMVQGANVHVLEAVNVVIKQQEYSGFQLAFTGGLDLPTLQLLPNSWPAYSRWRKLCFWALDLGRVNLVMKDGEVHEPPAL